MSEGLKIVSASLHTIEFNGEVHPTPVETYGQGSKKSIAEAFRDFNELEPHYPKQLKLRVEGGVVIFSHDYHGRGEQGEPRESGTDILVTTLPRNLFLPYEPVFYEGLDSS